MSPTSNPRAFLPLLLLLPLAITSHPPLRRAEAERRQNSARRMSEGEDGEAFKIEPWYAGLSHFGPLDLDYDAGWNFRDMRLVADYTFRIDNISGSPQHPFMFVSPTEAPHPPLGLRNWKQGKIGVGRNGATLPGGGGGVYPFKGIFNITLRTDGHPTRPRTVDLVPVDADHTAFPRVRVTSSRQVVSPRPGVHGAETASGGGNDRGDRTDAAWSLRQQLAKAWL